jgi:magnesium chelatase subunit I
LDVAMVFTANPEDYTSRGKIVTPLKDRIGSEIRTHYPATLEHASAITQQEAWTERGVEALVPRFVRDVVESVAFAARRDKKIDQRSGVSQRLPIAVLELTLSSAERRALKHNESPIVPRIADIHSALPAMTGKLELEYEGELFGADRVARDLIRTALTETFTAHLGSTDLSGVIAHFAGGESVKLSDESSGAEVVARLKHVSGLMSALGPLGVNPDDAPPLVAAAAEFVLEGLCAHKKIGRSEDRGYTAADPALGLEFDFETLELMRRMKRQVN